MLTIKKVDFETIPVARGSRAMTKNLEVINEFINGKYDAAEITDNENSGRQVKGIVNAMNQSIKRFGYGSAIIAIMRGGKAYLVRKELLG